MLKVRTAKLAMLICMMVLAIGCDSTPPQPNIKTEDAVRLAKQAAAELKNPPHTVDRGTTGGLVLTPTTYWLPPTNEVAMWPDAPGDKMVVIDSS